MSETEFEILLVEDNQGDVRLDGRGAPRDGRRVPPLGGLLTATRRCASAPGGRARGRARARPHLLDLNLPGRDGREALAQAKTDPDRRHCSSC